MSLERESGASETKRPRRGRRGGLAGRLTGAFVLLAGVLLLIMGLVLTRVSYNAQLQQVVLRQQKTADEAALLASIYLARAVNTLQVYGETGAGTGLLLRNMSYQTKALNDLLHLYSDMFRDLTLLDSEGNELARVSTSHEFSAEELGSQADSPAFSQAISGTPYIADEIGMLPGEALPVVEIGVHVQGRDRPGVLLAQVSIEGLWEAVAQIEVGKTGYAYIVDRDTGALLGHSDTEQYFQHQGKTLEQVPIVAQIMTGKAEGSPRPYKGLGGEQVIGAAAPIPHTNWAIVVELPATEAMADIHKMLFVLVGLIVAGVLGAAGLGLVVPQQIIRPLETLQEGVEAFGAGHLDHTIDIQTDDELQDLAEAFNEMATRLRASRAELERWGHELEDRVKERTRELAEAAERMRRRAVQMQTSAEVARAITSVQDLDQLLTRVTQLISERFGWYHVGIFLLDEQGEYAVLEAANSEGGQRMLARGHRLKVGEVGIVGSVTGTGEPRIALDVGTEPVYFDNPDLPHTRSEMALPLKIEDRVLGALDVQSTEAGAYDDEDVSILSILADQIAIAIENARLLQQTQEALEEVEALHQRYIQREWAKETARKRELVVEYRRRGVPALEDDTLPEVSKALTVGDVVVVDDGAGDSAAEGRPRAALAAPIRVRDQVIGVLDLQDLDRPREWTEDDIAVVQAISDQVGQALETARLFEEATRRAEQMATLNRIGLDLTAGLEMERVLQSLYEQCRQVLSTDTFYVAFYDNESGQLSFPLLANTGGRLEVEPVDIRFDSGFAGHIVKTRQPLHVPDIRALGSAPYQPAPICDLSSGSYLGVPLLARGQVMGVLAVQSREPRAYEPEDVELLMTIAAGAAIAIENARAYEHLVGVAEELRELDRLKMQFLANMSHELRTPLNSIIGFARVMLKGIDGPLTEMQETDLTSIYNSGQHLLSLINSILDMSKIEAGKMDLNFEKVSLPEVIDSAVSVAKALVKDRPIELVTTIPETLPPVWADAQRVRQILLNLLSNAAKFTEQGRITLAVESGPEFVTISVSDTGIGIEPEAQERLFAAFQQVDGSTTRRAEGTGLGLAISRSFVELHGGEIWVESEPGVGSTFYFTLPVYGSAVGEQRPEDEVGTLAPGQKVILAIDDDAGVITLLKRYLQGDGYQVVGVTQSLQALGVAQRLAPNLAAIMLDVVMPGLDGWQLLRDLKQDPATRDVPVVLCSIVDDLERGLELGAALYLRKPVTRDEVLDALGRLERQGVHAARSG